MVKESKPSLVSNLCVVYDFKCGLCDAVYVGFTTRNLHKHIDENRYTATEKRLKDDHCVLTVGNLQKSFSDLKRCEKFECLNYEMLLIKKEKTFLNTQIRFEQCQHFYLGHFSKLVFLIVTFFLSILNI